MIYIFDIDGTLTPSRAVIDPKFKTFFEHFMKNNRVWLISGSDKDKTIEQIGHNIWGTVERAYQCSGNELYKEGELVYSNKWKLEGEPRLFLQNLLQRSQYPHRFGRHFEDRPGMLNFSIVGRDCTQYEREQYYKWDNLHGEREKFAKEFRTKFPDIDLVIGGEISMDIHPSGFDKGQVNRDVDDTYTFFGDQLQEGGNDYPVKRDSKSDSNVFYHVKSWEDTYKLLS